MESLLQDIPSVVVYIDDILITGASDAEHLQTLEKVLNRLERSGLRLKRDKCVLMAESVVYLGHKIDKMGLHPTEEKVRAVQEAPRPKNVTELAKVLPGAADLLFQVSTQPIHDPGTTLPASPLLYSVAVD